jgi:hypothetical protein
MKDRAPEFFFSSMSKAANNDFVAVTEFSIVLDDLFSKH